MCEDDHKTLKTPHTLPPSPHTHTGPMQSGPHTCLLDLVKPPEGGLPAAVSVAEGRAWRGRGEQVLQAEGRPGQMQAHLGAGLPQHLQGLLLAAALQVHPVHLEGGREGR